MQTDRVCGVIVTFHPRAADLENLRILCSQVTFLVVVDNGSSAENLLALRAESERHDFVLLENGRNLGIGAALNEGVRRAKALGAHWVALFDQDSQVTSGFITFMVEDFLKVSQTRNIRLLIPRYRDPETGVERGCGLASDGGPFVTITSGSFLPIGTFDEVGYFNEELFIYTVDDEFSLRLRSRGYSIGASGRAVLLHRSGTPTYKTLLGKTFSTTNYRATVRYYITRNRVWMTRHYGGRYPRWARGALRASLIDALKVMLAEEDRLKKLAMITKGLYDGIRNRLGPLVDV